ncbi:MAG TPA: hypothetical protein V6D17_02250 [Candidatus Obscuribacterales bacterium]
MKSPVTRIFSHRVTKVFSFLIIFAVGCAGLLWYASQNGGIVSPFEKSSVTWLTRDNVEEELKLSQDGKGSFKASPDTVVLIVECVPQSCDMKSLNLAAVAKRYSGKVKILAINPYDDAPLTQLVEQAVIYPAVAQEVAVQLAIQYAKQYAAQNKVEVTGALVQQILSDPQFRQVVLEQLASMPIVQPVYPKFFLFSKKLELLNAELAIQTEEDLVKFIEAGLNPPAAAPSNSGSSSPAPAAAAETK